MTEVPAAPDPLEPLPEDWTRGLAVVAHPDDMEYGAAAAIARWTSQGKEITYALVTSGEAGIDGLTPEEAGLLREAEERDSAAIVGVDVVDFLGFPDGVLEYGLPLRRALARVIRERRPEMVVTINFAETFGGAFLNQADHIATGRTLLDAIRDAGNRWVFRDLLDEGLEPWAGVRQLWAAGSPNATHGVDVTDAFDRGVASLQAHTAYLSGLGDAAPLDVAEFLEGMARPAGTRLGCRYAVSCEVFHFDLR